MQEAHALIATLVVRRARQPMRANLAISLRADMP